MGKRGMAYSRAESQPVVRCAVGSGCCLTYNSYIPANLIFFTEISSDLVVLLDHAMKDTTTLTCHYEHEKRYVTHCMLWRK